MVGKIYVNDSSVINRICNIITVNKSFLITTHYNIDGDGLGSEIAFYLLLKTLGKKVEMVNDDKVPCMYRFLPCIKEIKTVSDIHIRKPDVSIVLDCGVLERTGKVAVLVQKTPITINIDHHFSNTGFGTVNFISDSYSSTGEMVYSILKQRYKISKKQAICLYTAILTDTGKFTYNIKPYTMSIAQQLIEIGISPEKIAEKVYMEKPLKSLNLLALVLGTLKYEKDTGVCWMTVNKEMYATTGTKEQDTEGFIEILMNIKEAKAVFLLKEENDSIKASLRSKGRYDVEKIARKFGGGGHKQASGCRLKNVSLSIAAEKLLEEIRKHKTSVNPVKCL